MTAKYIDRPTFLRAILEVLWSNWTMLLMAIFAALHILCTRLLQMKIAKMTSFMLTNLSAKSINYHNICYSDIATYSFILLINAEFITFCFCFRRNFLNLITKTVESSLFRSNLTGSYEKFYAESPFKNLQRMNRQSTTLRLATETLIFGIIANCLGIMVGLHNLFRMIESTFIPLALLVFSLVLILQYLVFSCVIKFKKEAVENEEETLSEFNDLYENFLMVKLSAENDFERISDVYRRKVVLKHRVVENLITFSTFLILFGLQVFILVNSKSAYSQLAFYCITCTMIISTVSDLISSILKFENRRLEINHPNMDVNNNRNMEDNVDMANNHIHTTNNISTNDITPNDSPFIKIKNASVFINNLVILQDINLNFYRNDVIALVGPNGSGKSVFFKFLLGFLRHSGDISLDGKSVNLRCKIGYCPASPSVINGTILENLVDINDEIQTEALLNIAQMLEKYQMHDFYRKFKDGYQTKISNKLSNNILQAISVMRALVRNSDILLLDEPFTYIDWELCSKLLTSILENRENKLILVILHKMDDLRRFRKILKFEESSITMYDSYEKYKDSEFKQYTND